MLGRIIPNGLRLNQQLISYPQDQKKQHHHHIGDDDDTKQTLQRTSIQYLLGNERTSISRLSSLISQAKR